MALFGKRGHTSRVKTALVTAGALGVFQAAAMVGAQSRVRRSARGMHVQPRDADGHGPTADERRHDPRRRERVGHAGRFGERDRDHVRHGGRRAGLWQRDDVEHDERRSARFRRDARRTRPSRSRTATSWASATSRAARSERSPSRSTWATTRRAVPSERRHVRVDRHDRCRHRQGDRTPRSRRTAARARSSVSSSWQYRPGRWQRHVRRCGHRGPALG